MQLTDRAFRDMAFARYLMKLHIVPTLMDAHALNSTATIHTLAGIAAEVTHKDGVRKGCTDLSLCGFSHFLFSNFLPDIRP